MLHTIHVVPITVRAYSTQWGCTHRHVVAYRAVCRCGERGPSRRTVRAAREAFESHRARNAQQ